MTANVTFVVNSKKDVLAIPSEALKTKDGASMVLIRDQKGREIEKAIEVGVNNGKQVEIISGLTLGEVVLTRALELEDKKSSNPFAPARGGNPRGSKK